MIESKKKGVEAGVLKQKYLQCVGTRTTNAAALQEVVKDLIDQGVSRKTLLAWAIQVGYTKEYVSSLLSRILVSLGLRERRKRAGRKPSPDTLALLAHTRSRYGKSFLKILRADNCGNTVKRGRKVTVENEANLHHSVRNPKKLRSDG